jgi:alkanesulfonate monooxygenase SsuD/methylene tetrahydromethanopterin reductase-like flavin-dependent oxidoreductase (luciferase family)
MHVRGGRVVCPPDRGREVPGRGRFLDLYYSIDYSRARIETWSALGSPEECAESLQRFRGTGMEQITLRLCAWDQVGQLERVIREVLPYVNR